MTTPPSLWAVLLAAWLRSARQPGEHGRALSVAWGWGRIAAAVEAWEAAG